MQILWQFYVHPMVHFQMQSLCTYVLFQFIKPMFLLDKMTNLLQSSLLASWVKERKHRQNEVLK
jgi:hypothetical protein